VNVFFYVYVLCNVYGHVPYPDAIDQLMQRLDQWNEYVCMYSVGGGGRSFSETSKQTKYTARFKPEIIGTVILPVRNTTVTYFVWTYC
jgi:hypothetical protein